MPRVLVLWGGGGDPVVPGQPQKLSEVAIQMLNALYNKTLHYILSPPGWLRLGTNERDYDYFQRLNPNRLVQTFCSYLFFSPSYDLTFLRVFSEYWELIILIISNYACFGNL